MTVLRMVYTPHAITSCGRAPTQFRNQNFAWDSGSCFAVCWFSRRSLHDWTFGCSRASVQYKVPRPAFGNCRPACCREASKRFRVDAQFVVKVRNMRQKVEGGRTASAWEAKQKVRTEPFPKHSKVQVLLRFRPHLTCPNCCISFSLM